MNVQPRGSNPLFSGIDWTSPRPPPGYVPGVSRGDRGFSTTAGLKVGRLRRTNTLRGSSDPADEFMAAADLIEDTIKESRKRARTAGEASEAPPPDPPPEGTPAAMLSLFANERHELQSLSMGDWAAVASAKSVSGRRKMRQQDVAATDAVEAGGDALTERSSITSTIAALGLDTPRVEAKSAGAVRAAAAGVAAADVGENSQLLLGTPGMIVTAAAKELWESKIVDEPMVPHHYVGYANLLRHQGNTKGAFRVLQDGARTVRPACPELWLAAMSSAADDKQRRELGEEATSQCPDSEMLWLTLSKLYLLDVRVRDVLREAVCHCPGSEPLWTALLALEPAEQHSDIVRAAVKENPTTPTLWIRLARMETDANAVRLLSAGVQRNPQSLELWIEAVVFQAVRMRSAEESVNVVRRAFATMSRSDLSGTAAPPLPFGTPPALTTWCLVADHLALVGAEAAATAVYQLLFPFEAASPIVAPRRLLGSGVGRQPSNVETAIAAVVRGDGVAAADSSAGKFVPYWLRRRDAPSAASGGGEAMGNPESRHPPPEVLRALLSHLMLDAAALPTSEYPVFADTVVSLALSSPALVASLLSHPFVTSSVHEAAGWRSLLVSRVWIPAHDWPRARELLMNIPTSRDPDAACSSLLLLAAVEIMENGPSGSARALAGLKGAVSQFAASGLVAPAALLLKTAALAADLGHVTEASALLGKACASFGPSDTVWMAAIQQQTLLLSGTPPPSSALVASTQTTMAPSKEAVASLRQLMARALRGVSTSSGRLWALIAYLEGVVLCDPRQARQLLEAALLRASSGQITAPETLWLTRAALEWRYGERPAAVAVLQQASVKFPTSGLVWSALIDVEPLSSRPRKAAEVFASRCQHPLLRVSIARIYYKKPVMWPRASTELQAAVASYVTLADAWAGLFQLATSEPAAGNGLLWEDSGVAAVREIQRRMALGAPSVACGNSPLPCTFAFQVSPTVAASLRTPVAGEPLTRTSLRAAVLVAASLAMATVGNSDAAEVHHDAANDLFHVVESGFVSDVASCALQGPVWSRAFHAFFATPRRRPTSTVADSSPGALPNRFLPPSEAEVWAVFQSCAEAALNGGFWES